MTDAATSRVRVLRLTQLFVLVDYMAVGAMRTVLPYYAKHLGGTGQQVGGLETVYGIGQVVGALTLGWLSDARGRRFVLMLSFLGAAVGYSIVSLAVVKGSVLILLCSRLPVGLAKQTVTASRAMISDLTPPDEGRSEALALMFAGCSLGYALGPFLGGLLAERVGYTSPLPAMACATIFVLLIPASALLLPETSSLSLCGATAKGGDNSSKSSRSSATATARASRASAKAPAAPTPTPTPAAAPPTGDELLPLLIGVTLPEGALVMFSSTSLALLAQSIGWSPSRLGLYNSCWGVASGSLSLTLWPRLFRSGALSDMTALRLGVGSLGVACGLLSAHGTAATLWATLPLGTVAVGMIRTVPASLLTKRAPAARRGKVLGRLDAAGSVCRVVLPALCGWLVDECGLWAAFAAQAVLCAAGLLLIERCASVVAPDGAGSGGGSEEEDGGRGARPRKEAVESEPPGVRTRGSARRRKSKAE